MKAVLIVGLALLLAAAVRFFGKQAAGSQAIFAERLYQAKLLTAEGRDELLRRMRMNELKFERTDPFTDSRQEVPGTNQASILYFCAEAFQAEFSYRMPAMEAAASDIYIAGQAIDPEIGQVQRAKVEQELKSFGGDTAAWLRHQYEQQPARVKIEQAIPAEDSVAEGGWTIYPPFGGPAAAGGLHHWISEGRSIWGKTRTRTARDLLAVGLLDAAAYQQLQQLMQGRFMLEAQVCQAAATLMQHRETYAQDLAQQQQWLRKLQDAGQLSAAQRQRIARETQPYQLKPLFEVLGYCERGRVVDLHQLPQTPQELYPALFREVRPLLPAFNYTDLRVTVQLTDQGADLLDQTVTLSFRADGRRYEHTFTHDYRRRDGADPTPQEGSGPSENFHQSINQWLADRNSPLRLYQAHTPDAHSGYGNERLGLMAMTAPQRKLWGPTGNLLSQESHDNRFNSAGIGQLLATYQQLGLFAHLSAADMARGRRAAFAGQKSSVAEVLMSFPHLLYVSDGEAANPPYPYASFTSELAAMSRGGFAPTQVHDGFGLDYPTTPTVPFSFRLGQQLYHTQLEVKSDWMDSAATELINRALREQHAAGHFYECLNGEGLIFLTPRQYSALTKAQPELFATDIEAADEELPF